MSKNIEIKDVVTIFGKDPKGLLAVITYGGTLGDARPQEIHVDTQEKRISIVFESGAEQTLCPVAEENLDFIHAYCESRKTAGTDKNPLRVGFYPVDKMHKLVDPCYDVDALII